jgi:hypothetical protein
MKGCFILCKGCLVRTKGCFIFAERADAKFFLTLQPQKTDNIRRICTFDVP